MAEIKVIATKEGYYGHQIRATGEEFVIDDPSHFSKKWMVKVEGKSGKGRKEEE